MKRVMAVIVLICMVGVAIGYIGNGGFRQVGNKTSIVRNLRESFYIKKRIMVRRYTKDICDYRESFGNDNMFTYSLFKVKKLVDDRFGLGIHKIVQLN